MLSINQHNQWKVDRDEFYSDLYKEFGPDYIDKAGFFLDNNTKDVNLNDTLNILCTPLNNIIEGLKQPNVTNPCILLLTGAFAPIHSGHIDIIVKSKEVLEKHGYQVVSGYISPDHDDYISIKTKNDNWPIHYRIKLLLDAIKDIKWLSIDPWAGIFNKTSINFTDIITRLKLYIKKYLDIDIPIFFICGGDNARFSLTFKNKGHCIVVYRPGYDIEFKNFRNLNDNKRHFYIIDGNNSSSSSQLRNEFGIKSEKKKDLKLRINEASCEHVLIPYFNKIEKNYVFNQKLIFDDICKNKNIISLDSELPSDKNNIKISRLYDLFGVNQLGFINRPGSESLNNQIKNIDNNDKEYFIFDDDICSGNTIQFANSLFKDKIQINGIISLNIIDSKFTEILDNRDFFIGNGLVIKLPNGIITRFPYVYPYVCPYIRGSIDNPMKFSIDMWKYQMDLYKDTNLKLSEIPLNQGFLLIGFNKNDTIYDICQCHYEMLSEFIK